MKTSRFLLLTFVLLLITQPVTGEKVKIMYVETIETYTVIEKQVYRWSSEREFLYMGHSLELDENNDTVARLKIQDDSNYGQIEEVVVDYKAVNFDFEAFYISNGSLSEISWDIIMIRNYEDGSDGGEPFEEGLYKAIFRNGGRRYDIKSNATFFSVNLNYNEFINVTGVGLKQIYTSTELSTNNEPDGTIIRSSIHVIKRDAESNIIYDFNMVTHQVNNFGKFFNIFDQPKLLIPFQYGGVFVLIILYNRLSKFFKSNKISLTKREEIKSD